VTHIVNPIDGSSARRRADPNDPSPQSPVPSPQSLKAWQHPQVSTSSPTRGAATSVISPTAFRHLAWPSDRRMGWSVTSLNPRQTAAATDPTPTTNADHQR